MLRWLLLALLLIAAPASAVWDRATLAPFDDATNTLMGTGAKSALPIDAATRNLFVWWKRDLAGNDTANRLILHQCPTATLDAQCSIWWDTSNSDANGELRPWRDANGGFLIPELTRSGAATGHLRVVASTDDTGSDSVGATHDSRWSQGGSGGGGTANNVLIGDYTTGQAAAVMIASQGGSSPTTGVSRDGLEFAYDPDPVGDLNVITAGDGGQLIAGVYKMSGTADRYAGHTFYQSSNTQLDPNGNVDFRMFNERYRPYGITTQAGDWLVTNIATDTAHYQPGMDTTALGPGGDVPRFSADGDLLGDGCLQDTGAGGTVTVKAGCTLNPVDPIPGYVQTSDAIFMVGGTFMATAVGADNTCLRLDADAAMTNCGASSNTHRAAAALPPNASTVASIACYANTGVSGFDPGDYLEFCAAVMPDGERYTPGSEAGCAQFAFANGVEAQSLSASVTTAIPANHNHLSLAIRSRVDLNTDIAISGFTCSVYAY